MFKHIDSQYQGSLCVANGKTIAVHGKGTVKFHLPNGQKVRLGEVLYVEGAKENLLSLDLLLKNGIEHRCTIKENYSFTRNGQVIAKGIRIGRASYLDWVQDEKWLFTTDSARLTSEVNEQHIYYRRLGHPGRVRFNDTMDQMGGKDLKLEKANGECGKCEICVKAKKIQIQNHGAVPRSTEPLRKVHMDFWGPRDGFDDGRYYLSLIDDYSRYSWLFVTADRKTETVRSNISKWLKLAERETRK